MAAMIEPPLHDETIRQALRAAAARLDDAELRCLPHEMSLALAQMARCYRYVGAWPSAEACLASALRWARPAGGIDQLVDLMCEAAEVACTLAEKHEAESGPGSGRAARERARDHAFEAGTLAGRVADAGWEVKVLLRISDVLERCGDRDDAVLLQTRALRLMHRSADGSRADPAPNPSLLPGLGRLADG
jgi:hypothetical protein